MINLTSWYSETALALLYLMENQWVSPALELLSAIPPIRLVRASSSSWSIQERYIRLYRVKFLRNSESRLPVLNDSGLPILRGSSARLGTLPSHSRAKRVTHQ